jgi:hypothetical protein
MIANQTSAPTQRPAGFIKRSFRNKLERGSVTNQPWAGVERRVGIARKGT